MFLEIAIAIFIGIIAGSITGLFPGIHINLVSAMLIALVAAGKFSFVAPLVLAIFIVAMAITHTFIDYIPSVFLGAPDEDTFLAVLPGHQLLRDGKGYEAVVYTLYGSLAAFPIILLFSLIFTLFLGSVYSFIQLVIPYLLLFISLYLILTEEEIIPSFVVFALAGILGLLTFNLSVKEPLLPLLSGLFGLSSLMVSIHSKTTIPKQQITPFRNIKLDKKDFPRLISAIAIAAPLSSFLPGIGSGHGAVAGAEILGEKADDKRNFLFLVGAINTVVMALSFVTLYAIQRSRTGAAVAVGKLLGDFAVEELFIILSAIIITSALAFIVGVFLARVAAKYINKINYSKISLIVIIILVGVNIFLSNWLGILVLITAAALGIFTITSNVRRINLMGALLIPTIVFYLTL